MQIQVHGKQIDVGEALRGHVMDQITSVAEKYFDHAVDAHATFSREAHLIRVDLAVHIGHGVRLHGHASATEPYPAFDEALDRIEKRLRRYKRRLRNHHGPQKESVELATVQAYVLAGEEDTSEEPEELNPVVIAETTADLPTISVGVAVMRLDLMEAPALMFRNTANNELNMVYRRPDGNIGWVDPAGLKQGHR